LYNLSKDRKVSARLQAEEFPLAVYSSIKEADPMRAKRLIKHIDNKALCILTELVLQLTVGVNDLESKLANLII